MHTFKMFPFLFADLSMSDDSSLSDVVALDDGEWGVHLYML